MQADEKQFPHSGLLTGLIICAILLSLRLGYLFLSDAQRFPINTVKVTASYQHISRKQLENILSKYSHAGFFSLSTQALQKDLKAFEWTDRVEVARVWPDTLKIKLVEKVPVATWNHVLITQDGTLIDTDQDSFNEWLPKLTGPENQFTDVLQIYQKLSKLLGAYQLQIAKLQLRDNQAWELDLMGGIKLHLGQRDIEQRLRRFCRAYILEFSDQSERLSSVDLRYAHGMAVQWKQ